jgi:hypothetical protein
MTGAEALLYFSVQIATASTQLGIQPPAVRPLLTHQRSQMAPTNVVAYVTPDRSEVDVMWWALWTYDKKTLRCVARHEALHVALGHGVFYTQAEGEAQHAQVDALLRSKWNEPAQCGLVK